MSKTLMIVDDSSIVRRAIEKYVSELDVTVVASAGDGRDAIEKFSEFLPDIVTLDMTMPEMEGTEVLTRIRAVRPDVAVIVITAVQNESLTMELMTQGAQDIIKKPFTPDQIKDAVRRAAGG